MVLSVVYLGRVAYRAGLELQARLVELRKAGAIGDVLVMLEHPPVLTLGRNAGRANVLLSDDDLRARGVELVETNRGGDVTYHGPGQLVGYPIFDLRGPLRAAGKRLGPVDFVRQMEEALIRTMADYGLAAMRVPGRTGVWTQPNGAVEEKKLAAIGIHVSAGVTSHGFALNVTTDLEDFGWIVPCGIDDRAATSLEMESRSADLTLPTAAERVARQFGRVFNAQMLWLESLDELAPVNAEPQVQA
ncbi:MAG TPA: lipoyl(octanoyl) transferase LipB [Acidobacteriaceae bacterium]|jgi:lipoyl(octanoyl) transferase|nr:lipoyl(octanoyl) transferase LipB [Acidobacteriaceae bacterium]